MSKRIGVMIASVVMALALPGAANGQGRGPTDWRTANGDAQRSAWVRSDPKISVQGLSKPGFQLLWKTRLNNTPRGLNSITPPMLLERLVGYRGFRMLGFAGGSSDRVFVIDTDLGRMEWVRDLRPSLSRSNLKIESLACPGGMTSNLARPTVTRIAPAPTPGGGGGRSNPARSGVGEPGQGAVTLAAVRPTPPAASTASAAQANTPPRPAPPPRRPNPAEVGDLSSGPFLIHALSSDGMLHSLHISNGADYEPKLKFLPAGANATGLIVLDNVAYVMTTNSCAGVADGIWAADLVDKKVANWKGQVLGAVGPAFGPDGTLYVTTGPSAERANSVVALDPKTLAVKDWYSTGNSHFFGSPVVFTDKGRTLVAVHSGDGAIHLLDASNLGGQTHDTPLFRSTGSGSNTQMHWPAGALASWQDLNGTRWILITSQITDPATSRTRNGDWRGTVVAWRIAETQGSMTLEKGWTSRALIAPLPPTIINGVVFVTSGGELRTRNSLSERSPNLSPSNAVLYALDGLSGRELWNSGSVIKSFARGAALSGGVGQIYLGTHDGTLYTFGFPMEH